MDGHAAHQGVESSGGEKAISIQGRVYCSIGEGIPPRENPEVTIADTSIWIEFLRNREPVHTQLRILLEQRAVLGVECIFGELLAGARGKRERGLLESFWKSLPKIDESGVWIAAGRLMNERKMQSKGSGLIDAAILAASLRTSVGIWTLDKELLDAARRETTLPETGEQRLP